MNGTESAKKTKSVGFSVKTLVIPLNILLFALMVAIMILTAQVNLTSADLAAQMQKSNDYQQATTKLQAGTSVLSESLTGFVQTPVIPGGPNAGEFNTGPLLAYAEELGEDRRAPQIVEYFSRQDVSEEIMGYILAAAASSQEMQAVQTHAISLILSVYPAPDIPALKIIPTVELTAEELAMPEEARLSAARTLLSEKSYSLLKADVSDNIDACHKTVQEQLNTAAAQGKRRISALRTALWSIITAIFLLLILTFLLFFHWIIRPLLQFAKDMTDDRPLKRLGRIKEVWSMVTAYNGLLDRRGKLEAILRTAAETDPLTGLPNRFHFEQSVLELEKRSDSLAVLLFDVNYLKVVNDTQGHLEGDKLLRKAAGIIGECFGSGRCYRIGGDEFAALLTDCGEEELKARLESFSRAQEREKISVSVGCATAEEADKCVCQDLIALADERMYAQKKQLHHVAAGDGGVR